MLRLYCLLTTAILVLGYLHQVFQVSQFLAVTQGFVGTRANNFWQCGNHNLREVDKFVVICSVPSFFVANRRVPSDAITMTIITITNFSQNNCKKYVYVLNIVKIGLCALNFLPIPY